VKDRQCEQKRRSKINITNAKEEGSKEKERDVK